MWQRRSFIVLILVCACNIQCSILKFTNNNAYTIPKGDINLEYGKGIINITCYITNKTMVQERTTNTKPPPSDFVFRIGKKEVPEDQIIRLNATAIQYINENPPIMDAFISCQYKNEGIGLNSVIVGTKPNNITDFDCIGYNLENLTCSWTRDRASKYDVNYTLSYYFVDHRLQTSCGEITETNNTLSCFWNSSKQPYYRTSHEKINFNLIGKNYLGISNQSLEIDHYRKVKISAPVNLKVINDSISSFLLLWQIPDSLVASNVYLKHRIMYTYQNSGFPDFKLAGTHIVNCKSKNITYNLTDLPFAYTIYDIRVGVRINGSDSDEMWSPNATLTRYSRMTLPGAPIANINGFYNSNQIVTIYWKQMERLYQNGENFTYIVENNVTNNSIKTTDGYSRLSDLNLMQSYTFEIRSENSVGISKNFSTIVIPPLNNPKMAMDYPILKEYSSSSYQLSWAPPIRGIEHLVNYTVYWCESVKVSSLHVCSNLSWVILPKNVTSYNITISPTNNVAMAISANGIDESTSMIWPECTVRHDKPLQKITDVFDKPGATNITIKWNVKCIEKTKNIEHYYIEYCRMEHTDPICKEGDTMNQTVTIKGGYSEVATITNLEPYTTYRIQICMIDFEGSFSTSDPIFVTTVEGTPASPYDLKIRNETNSSISLEWSIPQKGNSKVIRYFHIEYNNKSIIVNRTITVPFPERQFYTLTELNSYETYAISIRACIADKCSAYTSKVFGNTKIGRPSKIEKIHFNSLNNSVVWDRPIIPGGKVDYYEIEVLYSGNEKAILQNLTETMYALEKCGETSPYSTVSYKVRAVNMGEDRQVYSGPWSSTDQQKCQKPGDYRIIVYIIMSVILFGVILIIFILFGKRCYIYFITMKDVQFQLPEGLYDNKDRFPRSNEVDYIKEPPGDDQFLLYDKDGIKRSGDSSGCSSGQDSAESDSGTSLSSSTDSGTEQPRVKDENLVEVVALEDFNSSTSGNSGAYCQLGYPNSHTESKEIAPINFPKDIPYIRPNENNSSSDISPYIRCDQMPSCAEGEARPVNPGYVANPVLDHQMASSGYVPHLVENKKSGYVPHPPSGDKNLGYVMAADKSSVMPSGESKGYVQVADVGNPQMLNNDIQPRSNGYVSYGDVKSLQSSPDMKSSSSYVSHKQLDEVLNKN